MLVSSLRFRINFTSNQNNNTRQIEPKHQHNHRPKRSVSDAVRVEVAKIQPEAKRNNQPQRYGNKSTRRDPFALVCLQIRRKIVNQVESGEHEYECDWPLKNSPRR